MDQAAQMLYRAAQADGLGQTVLGLVGLRGHEALLVADDNREERQTLDQSRGDDHQNLDRTSGFWLTSDGFDRTLGQHANPQGRTNNRQASTDLSGHAECPGLGCSRC